ncbi:MAG: sigma-70 family RNA polymerase sigma factor [Ruminiclostridium sp.]|nr:sigma-70 family RNA polymerase sigma factor [Ruminiclostridium sp.]
MSTDRDNSFITEHLALVHAIASKFKDRGIEYEELFSAGCVGLVKAGNRFEAERGLKFSTYAVPVIMGEIKQLFRDGGAIKVSRSLKELSLKVCRLRDEMIKNGEEPHICALAEKLGVSAEDVSLALGASLPPLSLSSYDDEDGDEGCYDLPVEPEQPKALDRIALRQLISRLDPLDRRLIILRYSEECTQSRTAELLGMTQVQVSRREKKILSELRKQLIC